MGGFKSREQAAGHHSMPVIFRKNLTGIQKDQLKQNKEIEKVVNTQILSINFKNEQQDITNLLSKIVEFRDLKTIWIGRQNSDCLFSLTINHIYYPNLTKISIIQCKLESLDLLVKIDAHSLSEINLRDNFITSLRPLRKLRGSIVCLNVSLNFITSWDDSELNCVNFAKDVDSLNLEEQHEKVVGQNIKSLFRLNCQTIYRLNVSCLKRINPSKQLKQKLKLAYQGEVVPYLYMK